MLECGISTSPYKLITSHFFPKEMASHVLIK